MSVPEAAQELRAGHMLLLYGSSLEDHSVLCQAAQFVNRQTLEQAAVASEHRFCIALAGTRMEALHIAAYTPGDGSSPVTGEVVSVIVECAHEWQTPSPIDDRLSTIRSLVDPLTRPEHLCSPGSVIVQRACAGGTTTRLGYTEAAVDLMNIAGLEPGAFLCEVSMTADADHVQRVTENIPYLPCGSISVESIARYRREHRVSAITETELPTAEGIFRLRHYQELASGLPYLVLFLGDLRDRQQPPPLIRLHSACMTGDIFGSQRCDCQPQLHAALRAIAREQRGVLIYLPQEGRGIGISAKLQAYLLQEQGYDTLQANERLGYPVDARVYDSAIEILLEMGLQHIRLMTNNPQKIQALEESGIMVERVPLETPPTSSNAFYLQTKFHSLGHLLTVTTTPP